jgi:hypothetical protein
MNKPVIKPQKDIATVVLKFEDGTEQVIDKGMVISLAPKDGDEITMTVDCCNINGDSYQNIMYGMLQLASQTVEIDEDNSEPKHKYEKSK